MNIKIVISRYNETLNWIENITNFTNKNRQSVAENILIYNKGEPFQQESYENKYNQIRLPNVGREGHTIFHHIYENYDNLDEYTFFLQGNPFDHSPNLFKNMENIINKISNNNEIKNTEEQLINFEFLSENFYYTYVFDCPHHTFLPMRITYNKVFNCNIMENKELFFGSGAQFIVSKTRILKRPREFYKNIIEILEYHVKPVEGWVIERLHNEIFNSIEMNATKIPIIIICYNNHKYVKNTIDQILRTNPKYKKSIIIMNNSSDDAKTIEFLEHLDKEITIKTIHNNGPWITPENNSEFYNELPEKFILTDPDLDFHPQLPSNFVEILAELSEKYKTSKIGFAIHMSDTFKMYPGEYMKNVCEWEEKFWWNRCYDDKYEIYHADIDTTFALINKNYWLNRSLRVAGEFTCRHLPFYINNGIMSIEEEYEYYKKSKYSSLSKLFFPYFEANYNIDENGTIIKKN